MVREGSLRKNASPVEQSWGPKVWFAIQGNIPEGSINRDAHHESWVYRTNENYEISKGKLLPPHWILCS